MNTIRKTNKVAILLVMGVCLLAEVASATINGMPSVGTLGNPVFNLTAAPNVIGTSDGDSMYMWLYGPAGAPQYPGPTLIVNQGDNVTVNLTNNLPVATSIVFSGLAATAVGGAAGLITQEAPVGGSVQYTFNAAQPGTYMYYSGTRSDLQVEMGLLGTIIVRPTNFNATTRCASGYGVAGAACRRAYGDNSTAYDREYLFVMTEADPAIHFAVSSANGDATKIAAIDMTRRHPVDWFFNGRNFPDTMSPEGAGWLPTQPYATIPQYHPGEKVLMRMVGGGFDSHPLHTHGQNHVIVARDARVLSTNVLTTSNANPIADLGVSDYTTTGVPGETVDAIWGPWTGQKLGWDIYGTASINPHTCNGAGPDNIDPATFEYCNDHYKPIPVSLPPDPYVAYGDFYNGTPYLGVGDLLPPLNQDGTVHTQRNPEGGIGFLWHSHSERELTTNNIFIGGMATMSMVIPNACPTGVDPNLCVIN